MKKEIIVRKMMTVLQGDTYKNTRDSHYRESDAKRAITKSQVNHGHPPTTLYTRVNWAAAVVHILKDKAKHCRFFPRVHSDILPHRRVQ